MNFIFKKLKKETWEMHIIEYKKGYNFTKMEFLKILFQKRQPTQLKCHKDIMDYIQIFNKAELIINIEEIVPKKMGFLRQFMRKNKSIIRKAIFLPKQKKREENPKNKKTFRQSLKQNKNDDYQQINLVQITILINIKILKRKNRKFMMTNTLISF
ncbi:unnamed protein product [Paramecium sonneborni]|uniref:Uncharacterized protein n=1 Tax=Paramecium sonneborni TaxID=65129 RepID=A0A8S1MFQ9_9CILI|nr:unnamed protein product [Paramecium sonneborni]